MAIYKLFSKILLIQTYHTTCVSFSCQFSINLESDWLSFFHPLFFFHSPGAQCLPKCSRWHRRYIHVCPILISMAEISLCKPQKNHFENHHNLTQYIYVPRHKKICFFAYEKTQVHRLCFRYFPFTSQSEI